ncbi:cytochrome-c oxidase, cbb3-type subunit III [Xinfangfangia sp. CPCC 101601]|uniref:Cbb3-type cytochrome c oxidase subunit n=1 Tax=Pseudogemmobacter lacusdianii TaxID=3069608 RepID=A0ABU0VW13_9RHOB|nr:cytochrome-c oxidase, cbb3-type subunit III [Xinfangfangia sp. CPCC 101601]MDQ2065941.1 cytochrome-c oxidase, cbb3-type subunit III [Xinfangfangia sp. CPCC 101601]
MCAKKVTKPPHEVPTTGHEWDGIQEYDNPMPRWWVWIFYATIIWGIGYTVAYPAWPWLNGVTQGVLGYNAREAVAADIAQMDATNAAVKTQLVSVDLNAIGEDEALASYASRAGAAVFKTTCAQCHGAGAAGVQSLGYPNLLDDDWLWGGSMEEIHQTVAHGIRSTTDAESRYSEMPKFGTDGLLEKAQIAEVVEYVLQISGQEHDAALASAGGTVYADNCSACHGAAGEGDRSQGAPKLTDAVWLYGNSREAINDSVSKARFGVMPEWAGRLTEDQIRAVSFYVHSLGGGE